jgi:hypothetical protein
VKQRRTELVTYLMTGVVAATLVTLVYFSLSSLPFLTLSPAADANFGKQNELLLKLVPERVGFAVSSDAITVAAWSTQHLSACTSSGEVYSLLLRGIQLGAYDKKGNLWLSVDGPQPQLISVDATGTQKMVLPMSVNAMVRTNLGIAVLQPSGHVLSIDSDGNVLATQVIQSAENVVLSANSDGTVISIVKPPMHQLFDSQTLLSKPSAPCAAKQLWWTQNPNVYVLACLPMDSGAAHKANHEARPFELECNISAECEAGATKIPHGIPLSQTISIEPCDGLPCTSVH